MASDASYDAPVPVSVVGVVGRDVMGGEGGRYEYGDLLSVVPSEIERVPSMRLKELGGGSGEESIPRLAGDGVRDFQVSTTPNSPPVSMVNVRGS